MRHIVEEVECGKGKDISVLNQIEKNGETVFEQEGDSVMYPFLMYINGFMYADFTEEIYSSVEQPGGIVEYYEFRNQNLFDRGADNDSTDKPPFYPISSISGGNPVEINVPAQLHYGPINNSEVVGFLITGVKNNNDLLGEHFDFNIVDETTIEINGITLTGNEDISNAYIATLSKMGTASREADNFGDLRGAIMQFREIALGRSDLSNSLETYHLQDMILEGDSDDFLQYNPNTLNEPEVNLTNQISTIKMSREVQNNGNNSIEINEIGIYCDQFWRDFPFNDEGGIYHMIARDQIPTTTISSGSTVSFTYSIRTSCDPSGGVMTNFNELIWRQLNDSKRNVNDINNADQSHEPNRSQLDMTSRDGHLDRLTGVQVGSSTQDVDEANTNLVSRIPYGESDGTLFPVGSWMDKMVKDTSNNRWYFDISRIFENRGSTPIDINELGLYTNGPSGSVIITRHKTGSTQTIAAGEKFKATVRFAINI